MKSFALRVPAHLVPRLAALVERSGRYPHPNHVEGMARALLARAIAEAEVDGEWLNPGGGEAQNDGVDRW